MNEGAILKHLRRENIVSPNKPTTHNPSLKNFNASYAGGYLLEQASALWDDIHGSRKLAFSRTGEGYGDFYN